MSVNEELDKRYGGDATKLYDALQPVLLYPAFTREVIVQALKDLLINGCFCPSCMLSALNHYEEVLCK